MRLLPATAAGILMALLLVAPAQAATTLTVNLESKHLINQPIRPSVTLTTSPSVNGTLRFFRYTSETCSGSSSSVGTISNVNNGDFTGPNLQMSSPEDWGLRVMFDASGTTSDFTTACMTYYIRVPVTLGAQLPRSSFEVGSKVEPPLALQGETGDAGGEVKVTRWNGAQCQGTGTVAGTLPVTGGQIQGAVDLPSAALGVRSYRAEYSGDEKNTDSVTDCHDYTVGARIRGTVYLDADGNGARDPGETGLPDVKITLKRPQGTSTTQTNANGVYEFLVAVSGEYTLTQTQPGEYVSTTADELTLNVATASVENQDFGEARGFSLGPLPTLSENTGDVAPPDLSARSEGGFATLRLVALGLVVVAAVTLLVLLLHRRWRKEDEWY